MSRQRPHAFHGSTVYQALTKAVQHFVTLIQNEVPNITCDKELLVDKG